MPPVSSRTIMMSRPRTISGFSVEASTSASKTTAGRRLANSSISLRSRSKPRSGLISNGSRSHFGPPTAPSRTASAASASAIVLSVIGTPCASIEAPPTSPCETSKPMPRLRSSHSMTRRTSAITSGPMPSPARINSRLLSDIPPSPLPLIADDPFSQRQPGSLRALLRLERRDLVGLAQRQADIVESAEQARLAERIDLEVDRAAVGQCDLLPVQIDGEDRIAALLGRRHEGIHPLARQEDGQNAILEAIVKEDVGKTRSDNAADAEVEQRPRRVLARRATAEVLAGNKDPGVAPGGSVQDEAVDFVAPVIVAHLEKQALAEAGTPDGLQELLRNDHVRIDIDHRQRRGYAGQSGERLHVYPYLNSSIASPS